MTARQKAMTGIASRRGAFFLPLHLEGWGVLGKLAERPLAVGGETAMGSRPLESVETRIIRQGYKRNFKIFPPLNRTGVPGDSRLVFISGDILGHSGTFRDTFIVLTTRPAAFF